MAKLKRTIAMYTELEDQTSASQRENRPYLIPFEA